MKAHAFALLLVLGACAVSPANSPAPSEGPGHIWRLTGLDSPESAALSGDGAFLYVTHVTGEADAHDGGGFISRVSLNGELLDARFAGGLNGPKGIVQSGGVLYVSDIDRLAVIDANTGALRQSISIPGAQFLNDVALAPDGGVLIADSGAARIYVVNDATAEIWLQGDLLASINGLLAEPTRLVATTMQGRLLAIDYQTRAIRVLAEGLGNGDGVAALGDGRYVVTAWPGEMFVVNTADGTHARVMDTRAEPRFLNDILLIEGVLYVPHWEPGELSAYRVDTLVGR